MIQGTRTCTKQKGVGWGGFQRKKRRENKHAHKLRSPQRPRGRRCGTHAQSQLSACTEHHFEQRTGKYTKRDKIKRGTSHSFGNKYQVPANQVLILDNSNKTRGRQEKNN